MQGVSIVVSILKQWQFNWKFCAIQLWNLCISYTLIWLKRKPCLTQSKRNYLNQTFYGGCRYCFNSVKFSLSFLKTIPWLIHPYWTAATHFFLENMIIYNLKMGPAKYQRAIYLHFNFVFPLLEWEIFHSVVLHFFVFVLRNWWHLN